MATEEEERRRRREEQAALTGLTPEYIDMLERQLSRQRGEETPEGAGADYYTPPLTKYAPISDSRSKRTGLMRPVGNVLDRLFAPGWQANMNRRQRDLTGQRQAYAEQRPTQAAQQSALLTDSQLEALKQKVSDPNATPEERAAATKYLSSYVQALSTRAGGSTVPPWSTIAQEGGIDAGGGADVVRRPRAGEPNDVTTPPVTTPPVTAPSGPTTPSDVARQVLRDDFQHGATLALYPDEAIQQATSKLKARKVNEQQALSLAKEDLEQHPNHPQTSLYIQKAEARIADIDTKLSTISGSSGAGGATQAGASITQ